MWRFALALFSIAAAAQSVGVFESHSDVGVTPKTGSAEFVNNEYRITGGGANVWGTEDAFQFVWKKISGDVTITADARFEGTGAVAHRKVMLMIRQDLTAGSAYADIALHGDGLTSLQFRPKAGAPTQEIRSTVTKPTRLRIQRQGNRFTITADGTTSGPQVVEMSDPVYIGLAVCSHDANILETAVLSNVQVQQPQRYRSKVTVFELGSKKSTTVFEQDGIMEAPNWSRDGKWLLVNTGGNLYRLPLNGEKKLEKIEVGEYRCNNDHDLTRDGKMLAFSASSAQSRGSQVYVANGDGSNAKLLTPATPSYFHGWSPDNKWLAFVGQRGGKFTLFRVPVEGGEEQRLTTKGYDDGPEYSPDGKWIYFNTNRDGNWNIWRMPADGAGANDEKAERVTNDEWEDWFPHFSPNGKHMLMFSFPKGTEGHNDRMPGVALRIRDAKKKDAKIQTLITFFGGQGTINVNSWSPDSKKFAYVVYEPVK